MGLDIIARAAATAAGSAVGAATTAANNATAAANSANTTATAAQTAANSAATTATAAQSAANAASTAASAAQTTANSASTAAAAAQSTANSASTAAAAAQSTANSAQSAASTAQSAANSAATNASTALSTANTAATNASNAVSTANTAATNATAAQSAASSASTAAAAAQSTANAAQSAANAAQTTANTAATNAAAAQTAATNAASTATAAQTTANTAATNAALALASAAPADLFVNIGSKTIDASVTAIVSSGYSTLGIAVGTYVSDALATSALATAHPRFCKATANGRYFRLVPTTPDKAISVAQGGAIGVAGTNDQPAIQATISYACATGCKWVEFPETLYELWTPIRTSPIASYGLDGHPMYITTTDGLGLRGCRAGTTLNLKNSAGGSKNTITQTVGAAPWQGGGIFILPGGTAPNVGNTVDWIAIENLIVDGGVTYNPADRTNTNLTDKGFWLQDIVCNRVTMRNCTFKNFGGEIYYVGGASVASQFLENCTFDGSPQSALNPSSNGKFTGINVQAGNSYQACEVLGAYGFTLIGGRFYDFYSAGLGGGPDPSIPVGYPFTYATRQSTKRPPWVTLQGLRVEGAVDALYIGAWVHGSLITVDARVAANYAVGHLRDIHLNIEAWCDQKSAFSAFDMAGPLTATTQINGGPVGAYYTPPSNIRVNVTCKRTQVAQAASRYFTSGVSLSGGLWDKNTVTIVVSGDAHMVYSAPATPSAGFAVPRVDAVNFRTTAQPFGGTYDYPVADKTYDVLWAAMTFYPNPGSWNITLSSTYGYADGQRVIFYHGDATLGKTVVFPANGTGLKLQRDRKLYGLGDMLELRFDGTVNKWVEERYVPAVQQTLTATASYDAPNLTAGGTTTTTITVVGASLGDTVTPTMDISLSGLIITGYVSAANVVTVVLYNPTGSAVNLAAGNLTVAVQRK